MPDAAAVEEAARLLIQARNPVLFVGSEVTRSDAKREIVQLAELLSLPVVQAQILFDDLPTRHPLFLDAYGWSLQTRGQVDLVVSVGARMPPRDGVIPSGAKVVHVTIEADSIGKVVPTDVGIVADVKEAARDLISAVQSAATKARL